MKLNHCIKSADSKNTGHNLKTINDQEFREIVFYSQAKNKKDKKESESKLFFVKMPLWKHLNIFISLVLGHYIIKYLILAKRQSKFSIESEGVRTMRSGLNLW